MATAANYSHVTPETVHQELKALREILSTFAPKALARIDRIEDFVKTEGRAVEFANQHCNRLAKELNMVLRGNAYSPTTEKLWYQKVQSELVACEGG